MEFDENEVETKEFIEVNPPEILAKDIKILIKYILFSKEFQESINVSKITQYYKHFSNCYLINITLWIKYKCYSFYKTLTNIIDDEAVKFKPINKKYKSKTGDENLINKIYSKLLRTFSLNQGLYDEKMAKNVMINLQNQEKNEIIFDCHDYDGNSILYPTNFEIVDEFIFNGLKNRYGNISEKNYLKCDVIINEGKIIIKDIKSKIEENNCLLIEEGEDDMILNLKYLINFSEENNRQELFESFIKNNYTTTMKNYESYFIKDSSSININYIEFDDNAFNFDEKHISKNLIKLFLYLYFFEDEISQLKKKNINENGNNFYYIINKEWMKIYKEYYNYNELCNHFANMKKDLLFDYNYKQLKECIKNKDEENINAFIYQMIKDIPIEIIREVQNKKKKQNELITKLKNNSVSMNNNEYITKDQNSFKYNGENEIISIPIFKLFNKLETNDVKELIKTESEKIECFIGERKLYIKSEAKIINSNIKYYLLNVGYLKRNMFKPSFLIYFYKKVDFDTNISFISTNSFSKFVENYNLIDNSSCDIQNNEMQNIGKICRISSLSNEIKKILGNDNLINDESMRLLQLIIYLRKFNKEKNSAIKNNEKQMGYFVNKEFIDKIIEIKIYKIMDEYINKNNNIKEIIDNNLDKNLDELSKLVQKKFEIKINKEINKQKLNINIYSTSYNVSLKHFSINSNKYIYFSNNFVLLNEEIYQLFRGWTWNDNYSSEYVIGENKIFIINEKEKYILVYNIKDNNELNLELILNFDEYENSFLEQISDVGYNKFCNYLLFSNEVSPLFNLDGNKVGSAYKYTTAKKDYTNQDINDIVCLDLRKILVLYMNYQKLKVHKNTTFKEYYLVSKAWIQKYKSYYNLDNIYKELEKNPGFTTVINRLNDIEENNFISDIKVILMLKNIPIKLLNELIKKEKNFTKKYKNNLEKVPQLAPLEYLVNEKESNYLFYYNDFELIESKIYKYLFENIDTEIYTETKFFLLKTGGVKNEAEKVLCLFDEKRIVIKLINNNINSDGKFVVYIGQLNSSLFLEIECFLVYDNDTLMEEHIQLINASMGFNNFCENFMNSKMNIKEIKEADKKYGFVVKKNQNKDCN